MSKFIELTSRSHCCGPRGPLRVNINVDRIVYFHPFSAHEQITKIVFGQGDQDEDVFLLVDEPYDVVAKMIGGAA